MAIDVLSETRVSRPLWQVWDYIIDPANDLTWIRALSDSRRLTPDPIGPGTRVERTASMLGRKVHYTTEVVGYEPGARFEMSTITGPAMHVTYLFEERGVDTMVRIRNQGGNGLMFKLFSGMIGRMVKGRVDGDLEQLKQVLEATPAA